MVQENGAGQLDAATKHLGAPKKSNLLGPKNEKLPFTLVEGVFEETNVAVICSYQSGNQRIKTAMMAGLYQFKPLLAIFVGVGGGVGEKVSLGTVVISDYISDHSYSQETDSETRYAFRGGPVDPNLIRIANEIVSEDSWLERIQTQKHSQTEQLEKNILIGKISAGNVLVTSAKGPLAAALAKAGHDVHAIEMESAACYDLACTSNVPFISIRGISDLLINKNAESDKVWQPIAAAHASAVAFEFIHLFWKHHGVEQIVNSAASSIDLENCVGIKQLSVPISGHQKPQLWHLQGIPFQEFCRDILAEDPTVKTCDQYGKDGTKDFGVDLIAPMKSKAGIVVAQCKAKKSITALMIRNATSAFLKHWETHWQHKQVEKFILIVACDLQDTVLQDELLNQQARFDKLGIKYEWWSNSTITSRLKQHPEIVQRYFGVNADYWVRSICSNNAVQGFYTESTALRWQLHQTIDVLIDETRALLEVAIKHWKEGSNLAAERAVEDLIRGDLRWAHLKDNIKIEILVFRGKLALDRGDLSEAKKICDEASRLGDFESVHCLRSLIAIAKNEFFQAKREILHGQSEESKRIQISILIREGKAQEALPLIEKLEKLGPLSADSLRLKALTLLLTGDVNQALATIDQAVDMQPSWKFVTATSGVIRYYAALSPSEIPTVLPPWPNPVDWACVKDNDEARRRLAEASNIFERLSEKSAEDVHERRILEGWRIAALANSSASRTEAESLCKQILEREPAHESAIGWIVVRQLEVSLTSSKNNLLDLVRRNEIRPEQILALLLIYLDQSDANSANKLLDQTRSCFDHVIDLWKFWKAQMLILLQRYDEVESLFEGIETVPLELLAVSNDVAFSDTLIRQIPDHSLNGRKLLNVCIWKSKANDWSFVAKQATKLVAEVQTQQAVRLAAQALFNVASYETCLNLLADNLGVFNGQTLPHDLKFLEVECYQRLGFANQALKHAEQAVALNPNTYNLIQYIHLLFTSGNIRAMVSVLRRVVGQKDLTATQSIRLAEYALKDDPDFAKIFWRKATANQVKDEYVHLAVKLGAQLGLEREPAYQPLMARFAQLAQSDPETYKLLTFDEVAALIRKQSQINANKNVSYERGKIPGHLIADLSVIYHLPKSEQNLPIAKTPPAYAYHENRLAAQEFPEKMPCWKLHADVSALLVAYEFDFLDSLLSHYLIRIPSETIKILLWYRQRIKLISPEQLDAVNQIIRLIDSRKILVETVAYAPTDTTLSPSKQADDRSDTVIAHIEQQLGWLIDQHCESYVPGRGTAVTNLMRKTNLTVITESLHAQGSMSKSQIKELVSTLSSPEQTDLNSLAPPLGSKIYIRSYFLEALAKADGLSSVAENYTLCLIKDDELFLRKKLEDHLDNADTSEFLTQLIDKINCYVQTERIELLPVNDFDNDLIKEEQLQIMQLAPLLKLEPEPNNVLWIDDRFINAHYQTEFGVPIATSWEVLKALAVTDFGKEKYFSTLLKMRKANLRYLPLEAQELFYHLKDAPVRNHQLVATTELLSLRAYLTWSIFQHQNLNKIEAGVTAIGFVLAVKQGVIGAWDLVWQDDDSIANKVARAEWLYNQFFANPKALIEFQSGSQAGDTIASITTELLFTALIIYPSNADHAAKYLRWLQARCVAPMLNYQPHLAKEIARQVEHFVTAQLQLMSEPVESHWMIPMFAWWCEKLPAPVKLELAKENSFIEKLGLSYVVYWHVWRFSVNCNELEKHVLETKISGKSFMMNIEGLGKSVGRVQILFDKRIAITFETEHCSFSIFNDEVQFLFNTPLYRREALMRQVSWFDVDSDKLNSAASALAYLEPASNRLTQLQKWQDANANFYYQHLLELLSSSRPLDYQAFLPPSMESLLDHFRLDVKLRDLSWTQRCHELLTTDPEKFVEVICGLPIKLEQSILETVQCLSSDIRRQIIKRLVTSPSPIARIHLLRLISPDFENRSDRRLRRLVIKYLLSEGAALDFEAFSRLMSWVENRFDGQPDSPNLPADTKLALVWLHTSKLYSLFYESGQDAEWINRVAKAGEKLIDVKLRKTDNSLKHDAAKPNPFIANRMLLSGLLSTLTSEECELQLERIADIAFARDDTGKFWPKPALMSAPSLTNKLESFMTHSIEDIVVMMPKIRECGFLESADLEKAAIANIRTSQVNFFWWLVLAQLVPNHASQGKDLVEAVETLFRQNSLLKLCTECERPWAPLIVASYYAKLSQNLKQQLIGELPIVANNVLLLATNENVDEQREVYFALLDVIHSASTVEENIDLELFSELTINLSSTCPSFANEIADFVLALWHELPPNEASKLWNLNCYLISVASEGKQVAKLSTVKNGEALDSTGNV